MSKVFEHYQELQELGLMPVPDPSEEDMVVVEPSDNELA